MIVKVTRKDQGPPGLHERLGSDEQGCFRCKYMDREKEKACTWYCGLYNKDLIGGWGCDSWKDHWL